MTQITLEDAGAQLSRLIQVVRMGEEVVITQNSLPVARLVSIPELAPTEKPRPQFGSARGLIELADDFDAPLEDFKEYME
jgi:prevent-host-death family protein